MSKLRTAVKATRKDYVLLCQPIPTEIRITLRTLWYGLRDIVVSLFSLITIPFLWLLSSTIILVVVFLRNYWNADD